jgi:hypothetical protein
MSLWKVELLHLFRGWRGWTLIASFLLATGLSVLISFLIDRNDDDPFPYSQTLEIYARLTVLAYMLFIGLIVSSLSFDSNRDLSTFLRLRFSVQRILITKILVFMVIVNGLFLLSFALTFAFATMFFDSTDRISFGWMLWGLFFQLVSSLFYVALVLFTAAVFKGAVASVLLTLGVVIGIPIISGILIILEILIRGIDMMPGIVLEDVSYMAKVMVWWPATTGDAQAFLTVTESEIATSTISGVFGQPFELDPYFRIKPLITSLVAAPLLAVIAWRTYSRREM